MSECSTPKDQLTEAWLATLTGSWSVFVKMYLIGKVGNVQVETSGGAGEVGTACYVGDDEGVTAEYVVTTGLAALGGSPHRWTCRLQFGPGREDVVLTCDIADSQVTTGVGSGAELRFVSDRREGSVFWKPLAHIGPDCPSQPDKFSLIVRSVSPSCWLLDECFLLQDDAVAPILMRIVLWHCRPGTKPVVDDAKSQIDAAKSERERARDAIDELRDRLEEALAALDQKTEALDRLEAEEEQLRNAFEENELDNAFQEQHRELLGVEPGVHGPLEGIDPIGHELSALLDLEQEASFLESEMGFLADSVEDVAENLAASLWTDTHYARGQSVLRQYGEDLPSVEMTFLGSAEPNVNNMKADARSLLASALRQYTLATTTHAYRDHDYAPVIAAFAKCCERAFADAFDTRVSGVIADPVVAELLTKPNDWEYFGPPEAEMLQKCDYCKVLSMLKGKRSGWSGTRNPGIALLLFSGRVEIRKGSRLESPNPLGLDVSDPAIQQLPHALIEFQEARNGFIHHDLATLADMNTVWSCFQRCIRGLLRGFYTVPSS